MTFVRRLLATEPARVMAVLESIVAVIVLVWVDAPTEAIVGIVASIGALHEILRSIVFAPANAIPVQPEVAEG